MLDALFSLLSNFFYLFLRVSDSDAYPPPLSAEEEREYFILCKGGDRGAREELIRHNMRLVAHIVKKYYTLSADRDDLISIGTIGLIKAIDSFNIDNGTRFATYASKCLQNEILMHFRSQKKLQNEISFNETIDTDREGNPLTYLDIVSLPDTIADDLNRKQQSQKALAAVYDKLTERERRIITLRYGLNGSPPKTQREVAAVLGCSRSYISRLEKAALEKIRLCLFDSGYTRS